MISSVRESRKDHGDLVPLSCGCYSCGREGNGKLMYLTYEGAYAADIEPICRFCKELIDRYEKLQSIDYDAVLAWERKKVEEDMKDYQRVLCNGKKVCFFRFCRGGNKMEIDDLSIFTCFRGRGSGQKSFGNPVRRQRFLFSFMFLFRISLRLLSINDWVSELCSR